MITIPVELGARSYRILVGPDALARLGPELATLKVGRRVALVSDAGILAAHGGPATASLEATGFEVHCVLVPPGEQAKTFEVARQGWDALVEARLDRSSTVVALGGGAVGDLAGFLSATYMRGTNFVQAPTTLLAQVDASIGGKTGIDHPRGKNLIGAFHQPRLVVTDTRTLLTLPDRDYRSGLAEVIKHGIVLDAACFADLERSLPGLLGREIDTLTRVVAGSCRIKAAVVERDEREADLRAVLNYGHTVGHGLEAATGFDRWTHGEAVALGIVAEARLAERLGLAAAATATRQAALLEAVGLPVQGHGADPDRVLEAMGRDKKARDGRLPFVLVPEIGRFQLVFDVPGAVVREVVAALK